MANLSPKIQVAAGILIHDEPSSPNFFQGNQRRVCLARRSGKRSHAGWWELPGGKLEFSETPEQALIREIREELALDVHPLFHILPADLEPANSDIQMHFIVARALAMADCSNAHDRVEWLSWQQLASCLREDSGYRILTADRPVLELLVSDGLRFSDYCFT